MMFRICAMICLFCGSSLAAQDVRDGLSNWYARFEALEALGGFEIAADIIHYTGQSQITADLQIYDVGAPCAATLEYTFCPALRLATNEYGSAQVHVLQSQYLSNGLGDDAVEISFRIGQAPEVYRLALSTGPRRDTASLFTGADVAPIWQGIAFRGPHVCEEMMCSADVFAQAKQPQPAGLPHGLHFIRDDAGRDLGNISFWDSPTGPSATGALFGLFGSPVAHETQFTFDRQAAEALSLKVTTRDANSIAQWSGHLLIDTRSHPPRGTLFIGNEIFLVTLTPVGTSPSTPEDEYDTPGFGIYKYTYRLRDIPANSSLNLRSAADRTSAIVGTLAGNVQGLQVITCLPEIDNIMFEEFTAAQQAATLARVWCNITTGTVQGWMPGRYLVINR
ncbi:hypothetical protein SAMN04488005_0958 [Yoonia tamlensis]|uniref:SH3 domain-containing protein n=2 Tax=Yoonia tamlensis TaxID=390270 RepID=A0A1I6G2J3_9RHOB|nr:hypothetical protein SAMN04488005_0958 [Yoonia tamlensis]